MSEPSPMEEVNEENVEKEQEAPKAINVNVIAPDGQSIPLQV